MADRRPKLTHMKADGLHYVEPQRAQARTTCPFCRRPLQEARFGFGWPVVKAAILDVLASRGELGASAEEILNEAYCGRRRPDLATIKAHIWQIRDRLDTEGLDVRIVRDGHRWILRGKGRQS
jgi:hypothetical protein